MIIISFTDSRRQVYSNSPLNKFPIMTGQIFIYHFMLQSSWNHRPIDSWKSFNIILHFISVFKRSDTAMAREFINLWKEEKRSGQKLKKCSPVEIPSSYAQTLPWSYPRVYLLFSFSKLIITSLISWIKQKIKDFISKESGIAPRVHGPEFLS